MGSKLPQITMMRLSDLHKNLDNPRIIKDDKFKKLVQSVRNFPQMLYLRPLVIDAENMVLGGNMRLEACKAAGMDEVPVVRADNLTAAQKDRFIIADNVPFGEWNYDALANLFDTGELADWGLDIPMPLDEGEEEENEPAPRKAAESVICPKCSHEFIPEK